MRLFADPANGDFHLTRESPAIGAGIDWLDSLVLPSDDLDGQPRPGASGYDLVAYQYIPGAVGIEDWLLAPD